MFKKLASGSVGLFLLTIPTLTFALVTCEDNIAGCTAAQYVELANGSSVTMESRIQYLQKAIAKLTEQIGTLSSSNTATAPSTCLNLNNALVIGSTDATTNGEVSKLQRFLAAYIWDRFHDADGDSGISQPVTGYYGRVTAQNVMDWQKAHGMDFVTPTSGVGPMTRAKMKCGSTGAPVITKVEWRIEPANPSATDSYKKDEQAIFVDVIRSDNSIRGYSVGKAYGCAASSNLPAMPGKKVLGFVNCYYALSGVGFTAYEANGKFIVERGDESARDGSVVTTVLLEI